MNAEWTTRACGDRRLVELTLTTDRPRRVRVEPTGETTLHPPRTDGVPDAGWDETGFSGVVDGRRGLGFAVDGSVGDPPVAVDWRGPPSDDPAFEGHPDVPPVEASAEGVVRALSDPRPPRAAVRPTAGERREPRDDGTESGRSGAADRRPETDDGRDREDEPNAGDDSDTRPSDAPETTDDPPMERAVDLATVERRVALAERLADADTLDEATGAVARAGGLDGVRALDATLAEDRERLRALADRVEALRARAASVDVPAETLARIAGEQS